MKESKQKSKSRRNGKRRYMNKRKSGIRGWQTKRERRRAEGGRGGIRNLSQRFRY